MKRQLDEVYDALREIKQQAVEFEDENRELREKLRFKSEEFEFKNPFWYEKSQPNRPLCPKCFAKGIYAPVSGTWQNTSGTYAKCLHCDTIIDASLDRHPRSNPRPLTGGGGPNGWMG